MEIRRKSDGGFSRFGYSYVDNVIKSYSGQDHMQVTDVLQLAVDTVQDHHPATKSSSPSKIMQMFFPHNN